MPEAGMVCSSADQRLADVTRRVLLLLIPGRLATSISASSGEQGVVDGDYSYFTIVLAGRTNS